jgi:hypothetical protein
VKWEAAVGLGVKYTSSQSMYKELMVLAACVVGDKTDQTLKSLMSD